MEKQITIIIPTYNMEEYIAKCLDSLIIPELEQIEVLVVNDGSKDRSSEIAHLYAQKYPCSIRVIDKNNGNYGSCINAALAEATGRYVKILDADDTFDKVGFSLFVQRLLSIDVDVIISEYLHCTQNGQEIKPNNWYGNTPEYDRPLAPTEFFSLIKEENIQMHRLTYKLSFLRNIKYQQTEGISYTDTEWVYIPLFQCKSVICFDTIVYRYLCDREGQSMSPEKLQSSLKQLFQVLESISLFINSDKLSGASRNAFIKMAFSTFSFVYMKAFALWNPEIAGELEDFDSKLLSIFPEMYDNIGMLRFHPRCRFYHFQDIRRKGYPSNYNIPLWVKIMISARNLLNI